MAALALVAPGSVSRQHAKLLYHRPASYIYNARRPRHCSTSIVVCRWHGDDRRRDSMSDKQPQSCEICDAERKHFNINNYGAGSGTLRKSIARVITRNLSKKPGYQHGASIRIMRDIEVRWGIVSHQIYQISPIMPKCLTGVFVSTDIDGSSCKQYRPDLRTWLRF